MSKLRKVRLNLALQGGGAHGSFTWGVLERLLEEPNLDIACISAASAGAVNAVAMTAGLIDGGREGAIARLAALWEAVLKAQLPDFMRPVARISIPQIMNFFSPYEFNPLGFDPLRNLLNEHVDFDRVRDKAPYELLIAATIALTGKSRLFRRHEITVETVLASACLPTLHRAVVIAGTPYWDGGFSANPDLVALTGGGFADDTLLVLLNPLQREGLPTRSREIAGQVNAITFNQPLLADARYIAQIKSLGRLGLLGVPKPWRRIHRHRFHLISAEAHTRDLPASSKVEPDAEVFKLLREAGRAEAESWLAASGGSVGRAPSMDLAQLSGVMPAYDDRNPD